MEAKINSFLSKGILVVIFITANWENQHCRFHIVKIKILAEMLVKALLIHFLAVNYHGKVSK